MSTTLPLDTFLGEGSRPADVPEGEAFRAWQLRVLSAKDFDALGAGEEPSRGQLAYLAAWGLLAPTSHNTVPQRLRLGRGLMELCVDRRAVLPASDGLGRQATISVGCVIANILLAARCYGLEGTLEVITESNGRILPAVEGEPHEVPVARLRFCATAARADVVWLEAMLARKLVRAEYDAQLKLDEVLLNALRARTVAIHSGLELHLVEDAPTLLFLGKVQELADSTVLNRDAFARELGHWLLENEAPGFVGMRGGEFGLSPAAARRLHLGLHRALTLLPDELAAFAKLGNLAMRSASAVAIITVARDDLAHRLAAGRAYEELAVLLQQRGLSTAIHAGLTEVEAPNLALRGRLRTHRRPTVVFRIGRPLHPEDGRRPHSARPKLASLLLPEVSA